MRFRLFTAAVSSAWLLCPLLPAASDVVEEKYDSGKTKLKYTTDAKGQKQGNYEEFGEDSKLKLKAVRQRRRFATLSSLSA